MLCWLAPCMAATTINVSHKTHDLTCIICSSAVWKWYLAGKHGNIYYGSTKHKRKERPRLPEGKHQGTGQAEILTWWCPETSVIPQSDSVWHFMALYLLVVEKVSMALEEMSGDCQSLSSWYCDCWYDIFSGNTSNTWVKVGEIPTDQNNTTLTAIHSSNNDHLYFSHNSPLLFQPGPRHLMPLVGLSLSCFLLYPKDACDRANKSSS